MFSVPNERPHRESQSRLRRRRRQAAKSFVAALWSVLSVHAVATRDFIGHQTSKKIVLRKFSDSPRVTRWEQRRLARLPRSTNLCLACWAHQEVLESSRISILRRHKLLFLQKGRTVQPVRDIFRPNKSESIYGRYGEARKEKTDYGTHEGPVQNDEENDDVSTVTRRTLLKQLVATGVFVGATPGIASAGKPELDSKTGQLFSPRATMLGGGGSDAARGIRLQSKSRSRRKRRDAEENNPQDDEDDEGESSTQLTASPIFQNIYETRFIAYLSRFLLTFDPAARSWWLEQAERDAIKSSSSRKQQEGRTSAIIDTEKRRFAEFAESVEIGLADYFVGPYGSYASVEAARAGLSARRSVSSSRKSSDEARQGILNLYALLKARYTSRDAKYQLAVLFSFISSPQLQPTAEITSLLGEADNAAIGGIDLKKASAARANVRLSSRLGGGYTEDAPPIVTITSPPALGDQYMPAKIAPVMTRTSRILRIRVLDGGEGYTSAPPVTLRQPGGGVKRSCDCCAVLDRYGRVESILVLDPGFGYGANNAVPTVEIGKPQEASKSKRVKATSSLSMPRAKRRAVAVADLEYEVSAIEVSDGGNGYLISQPPKVEISPPEEDPDWFLDDMADYQRQNDTSSSDGSFLNAEVSFMVLDDGNGALIETQTVAADKNNPTLLDTVTLDSIRNDPLTILPSSARPVLATSGQEKGQYTLPTIPAFRDVLIPSPRYRAFDPLFGGVGMKPVTVGAKSLSVSEYSRLALSGAVCVVVVRTVLNPLELVKTKIQLKNDLELEAFAKARRQRLQAENGLHKRGRENPLSRNGSAGTDFQGMARLQHGSDAGGEEEDEEQTVASNEQSKAPQTVLPETAIGTMDYLASMMELRGPFALTQSIDITFLSSLVFGSFGFGATELFRRSFTNIFFSTSTTSSGSEIVILIAAAFATVVTSAAATPLETLRVRSMGLVEAAGWKDVLGMFVTEKQSGNTQQSMDDNSEGGRDSSHFRLRDIRIEDLGPLWGGFGAVLSRELPFAVMKFLAFDIIASTTVSLLNSKMGTLDPVQVGVGAEGLAVSAFAGALAGIAGAIISHPADLVLTLTSSSTTASSSLSEDESEDKTKKDLDWLPIVQELLKRDGGVANLFIGLPARATFFFFVLGLQFFLYDFVKNLFQVSSEDLTLILDVFYAVRQGLVNAVDF